MPCRMRRRSQRRSGEMKQVVIILVVSERPSGALRPTSAPLIV
jgi:hypothetical protein